METEKHTEQNIESADLFVTLNMDNKVSHIQIANPEDNGYRNFIMEEVADAICNHIIPPNQIFIHYHFLDKRDIPAILPQSRDSYMHRLLPLLTGETARQVDAVNLTDATWCLCHGIMPDNTILRKEFIRDNSQDNQPLRKLSSEDTEMKTLLSNFKEYFVAKTPEGSLLFSTATDGKKKLLNYHNTIEQHFFDPKLEMTELQVDKVLAYPPNVTTSQIDLFDGKTLDIPKEAYYKGRPIDSIISSSTLDLTPTAKHFFKQFHTDLDPEKAIQNQTNHDIACLLYLKETGDPKGISTGNIPFPNSFTYKKSFAELEKRFCAATDENERSLIAQEVRDTVTEIIRENGLQIRGQEEEISRKQEQQTAEENVIENEQHSGLHM